MAKHEPEEPKPKRTKSRIPTFKTVEAAAEFWDTHSLADFEDELEEVTDVRFVPHQPKKAITVRLPANTAAALTREARAKGMTPSTLTRAWILEHLGSAHPDER